MLRGTIPRGPVEAERCSRKHLRAEIWWWGIAASHSLLRNKHSTCLTVSPVTERTGLFVFVHPLRTYAHQLVPVNWSDRTINDAHAARTAVWLEHPSCWKLIGNRL